MEEGLMLYVGWAASSGPDRNDFFKRWISADMECPLPDPPLIDAEMQSVMFAAKMGLIKVLRRRKNRP